MLDFPLNFILPRGVVLFFYIVVLFGVIAKRAHPQVNLFFF